MSTRVKYRKVYDEADHVEPTSVRMVGYLSENSKDAVPKLFPGTSKIFLLVGEDWELLRLFLLI